MASVPETIRDQLGGRCFEAMTGARNFLASTVPGTRGTLQFDLPARFAQGGINRVRVVLTSDDLYTVSFISWRPRTLREVFVHEVYGIAAESLRATFTQFTGLDCGGIR